MFYYEEDRGNAEPEWLQRFERAQIMSMIYRSEDGGEFMMLEREDVIRFMIEEFGS